MKFISAGHCTVKGKNYDPGATGVNGRTEAAETLRLRNAVIECLKSMAYKDIITDADGESLKEYLHRIKTGNGSVVLEFHFNAFNKKATGTEALVQSDADKMDLSFARNLAETTARILQIPNRGVKSEAESHRGRLGLMREQGIVCLLEVCFIDNPTDMAAYDREFYQIASNYASIIAKFDDLIK